MPFGLFDPRSIAMGGTGVSSGTGGNASYFNPALLAAAKPKDRFAFEMMFAARARTSLQMTSIGWNRRDGASLMR
jgi:hypothetical protein